MERQTSWQANYLIIKQLTGVAEKIKLYDSIQLRRTENNIIKWRNLRLSAKVEINF